MSSDAWPKLPETKNSSPRGAGKLPVLRHHSEGRRADDLGNEPDGMVHRALKEQPGWLLGVSRLNIVLADGICPTTLSVMGLKDRLFLAFEIFRDETHLLEKLDGLLQRYPTPRQIQISPGTAFAETAIRRWADVHTIPIFPLPEPRLLTAKPRRLGRAVRLNATSVQDAMSPGETYANPKGCEEPHPHHGNSRFIEGDSAR
jgi:hypothetical protein